MGDPLVPRVQDGRLYGRGAYDMKGGLAACLVAAAEAGKRGLRGDVVVTAVVDEELPRSARSRSLKHVRADAAIVAEPTQMRVVRRPQGLRRVRDRDERARRARLAARSRGRRDREDGPRPRRPRRARPVAARAPDAPAARARLDPCGRRRGRLGVLDVPGALRAPGRAADGSRRVARPGRGGAAGAARPAPPRRPRLPGRVADGRRPAGRSRSARDEEIVRLVRQSRRRGEPVGEPTGRTRR